MELPRHACQGGKGKKIKQTTDDILKLFTIIDEQNLKDHMPRYAAADLARVPFLNYDAINTIAMAKKIDALEQRMNSFEHSMSSNLTQFVCITYSIVTMSRRRIASQQCHQLFSHQQ